MALVWSYGGLPLEQGVEQSAMQSNLFDGCDGGYCFV